MSRIGVQPVKIEEKVSVEVDGQNVAVKGPKGELSLQLPDSLKVNVKDDQIIVERTRETKQAKSNHGTYRMLLENMINGVKEGFKKDLELVGMGYRASMEGKTLVMQLGWNHPIKVEPPEGIEFETPSETEISVSGIDKQLVGLWAAKIRSIRKPEPYKGKGIRYAGEQVRRKTVKIVEEE